jgi:phenylalanyl-tRNA synthetase beta chain
MKGVFAPSGTTIPGTGLFLKPSEIRGEKSNGMLCSEREMGLSDEHDGIIDLPEDAPIGAAFADVMDLNDPVIEVAITPNRQDCTGVYGIARDLAAAGLGTLKTFNPGPVPGTFESPIKVSLDFPDDDKPGCSCFVGRYIRGVKNGPSPDWMQRRLRAIGLRPISSLVDITNYITHDLGRPLHVFDVANVEGDIHARYAKDGEKLLALDGKEYELTGEMTVIADDARVEGIAGVMGGEDSGCTNDTTDVFVEAALFDPIRTAMTGRKLGIESDARYRFERGIDPAMVVPGAEYATKLIIDLCGGEPSEIIVAGSPDLETKTVSFRPTRVEALGGLAVDPARQQEILERLGFALDTARDPWQAKVPTWRQDVYGEADLVEDILRIVGYDDLPAVPLPITTVVTKPPLTAQQRSVTNGKRALASRDLVECVTWSFMPKRFAELFGGGSAALMLENPISSELDVMRPSILPNLLQAVGRNNDRGFDDVGLFEVGPQYADDTPGGQVTVAAGVRAGAMGKRHWADSRRPVDAFDAKADALATLAAAGGPADSARVVAEAPTWYHPGRSGSLQLGPKNTLAHFGEIHPAILEALDVKGPVVGFELFISNLPKPKTKTTKARGDLQISDFPAVDRDFAFIVDDAVTADKMIGAAKKADPKLISQVDVFDVYTGKGIADGQKSVGLAIRLEPKNRTLTDEEIDGVAEKVVAGVGEATGGVLRG